MKNQDEIAVKELLYFLRRQASVLRKRSIWLLTVGLVAAGVGFLYSSLQKPKYRAVLTFAAENEMSGNMGGYAGLAAQFGFNLGSGANGSAFEGENLVHLLKSKKIIFNTLFTSIQLNDTKVRLIDYYLNTVKGKEYLKLDSKLNPSNGKIGSNNSREVDSTLLLVNREILKSLDIKKIDVRSDIISVEYRSEDELFSKSFVEELVNNLIQYYTEYKVKKIRQNVSILERQTDSVRSLLSGNIIDIAVSSDLNVNPMRQVSRTGVQRKQIDAQVNGALYAELVKNLELSKLTLRKETPLIQIIDQPTLPLENKKIGSFSAAIIFGAIGVISIGIFFIFQDVFYPKPSRP